MATVIAQNNLEKHNVNKYNFKIFSMSNDSEDSDSEPLITQDPNSIDSTALSTSSKDSLIESLMQKTDEMSSNFIKLQMKLESMGEEHKERIIQVEKEFFNKGVLAGKEQVESQNLSDRSQATTQLYASIQNIEEKASEYEVALESIKDSLMSAAVDIAQETISMELTQSSNEIAQKLSNELIKELQSASKITLRVNPKNHGYISAEIGVQEHIKIISDSAISDGGVIATSDAGNIDAQIAKRFQRVKKTVLSE